MRVTIRLILVLLMPALFAACRSSPPAAPPAPPVPPVAEGYAVTSDSVQIWYRTVGNGPDVVLAPHALYHGTRLDELAGGSRKVVTYDQRGRGKSDSVPLSKVALDRVFLDLEAVAQAVGADSFAAIGWSGAGMELFVYALRHPGRITRLVQLAPVAPRWTPYGPMLMEDRARRTDGRALEEIEARRDRGEFRDNPATHCRELARVATPASFGDTSAVRLVPDVCDFPNEWPDRIGPYFGALFRTLGEFDWRPDLARVTIPRLVIHGELDNTPLAGNQEWVEGQPQARIVVIEGAGHWPHYETPGPTLAAIRDFLNGGWPAESTTFP